VVILRCRETDPAFRLDRLRLRDRRLNELLDGLKHGFNLSGLLVLPPFQLFERSSRRASSSWVASNWRKRTKVRMMATFT
jgi:hypothetical protein